MDKLIYLSYIRPNIAFLVSVVSQHMNNSREDHMEAANRILRYLRITPGYVYFSKDLKNVRLRYTQMQVEQER